MTVHYTPKTFLRQTSPAMLAKAFAKFGALSDLDWSGADIRNVEVVYSHWQALPDPDRIAVERLFEDAAELANESGMQVLIDEGQFHRVDIAAEWEQAKLEDFHDRALHVAINHPRVFEVAGIINGAHNLPQRYWRRRGAMPRQEPDVTVPAIQRFQNAISAFYRNAQGRGDRCTVDAYLRCDRFHYFFAYPDDYARTYLGHDAEGLFLRQPQKPAFEVVFIFDPVDGTLDLYAHGGKDVHHAMQTIFCWELLGQELPLELLNRHPYELNGLKSRDFGFPTDPADGIDDVRIRKLRLSVLGGNKRRILLEADPEAGRDDIYDMMTSYLDETNLPLSLVNVSLATFTFTLNPEVHGRSTTFTFDVSFPNSSNLKSKREDQRLLGEKYLKRWTIDRAANS